MKEQDLLNLKKKQDQAKEKISNLKGREESTLQQLKNDWDCGDEEQGEKLIEQIKEEESQLKDQYEQGVEELENWLEEQEIDTKEL